MQGHRGQWLFGYHPEQYLTDGFFIAQLRKKV